MFDYIQKFNNLPESLREKISTSRIVERVEKIEEDYGVNLAPVIMKVIVGEVKMEKLEDYLANNFKINEQEAKKIREQLKNKIFDTIPELEINNKEEAVTVDEEKERKEPSVSEDDLTFSQEEKEIEDLAKKNYYYKDFDPLSAQIERKAQKIIDESGIVFSSSFLSDRFKKIIITYLRSVRNQANTVQALIRPVTNGGVGLEKQEADQVLGIAKKEKIDLEEEPRFYPSKLKYSSDDKNELIKYPSKKIIRKEKEAQEEKESDRIHDIEADDNGTEKEKKDKNINKKEDPEQEKRFEEYQQERSYSKEAPGLDLSQLGGGRDIEYDLKSVLEHKYGNSFPDKKESSLKQAGKKTGETKETSKQEKDASKQNTSFVEQSKDKKSGEEDKSFFGRILEFLTGKRAGHARKEEKSEQKEFVDTKKEEKKISFLAEDEEREKEKDQKGISGTREEEEKRAKKQEQERINKAKKKEEEEKRKEKERKEAREKEEKEEARKKEKEEEKERKEKEKREREEKERRKKEREEQKRKKEEQIRKEKEEKEREKERRKEKEEAEKKKEKEGKERSSQEESRAKEGKKKVEDIKPAPKVMSPIDELRYMDLVKFRRLGEDAENRTLKIKKKIDLLGKESLAKKLGGIKAWRESYVNKIYLTMGQESIAKGVDIEKIIENRKENDKDYLSKEEFNSILDLNKDLRFY